MRIDRLALRGIGPFRESVEVDFSALSGQLVAITGPNGAGKSTLLELFPGAILRKTPTRGTLADLATRRDAYVEVTIANGQRWTIRQTIDGVSKNGESLVLDNLGKPVLTSGKRREFDQWAAAHLPSPEVFYSSMFAAQGSGGFLDLDVADRKGVLLRVLGIERLESLAERAREALRLAKQEVAVIEARIQDARAGGADVETAHAELDVAVRAEQEASGTETKALLALAEVRGLYDAALHQRRNNAERRQEIESLRAAIKNNSDKLADIRKRLANNRRVTTMRDEIERALALDEKLSAELTELSTYSAEATANAAQSSKEEQWHRTKVRSIKEQIDALEGRALSASKRMLDRDRIGQAAQMLQSLSADVEQARAHLEALEAEMRETSELRINSAQRRIDVLRSGLEVIAEQCEQPDVVAVDVLARDDETCALAAEAPERLNGLEFAAHEAKARLSAAQSELLKAEVLAARQNEIRSAECEYRAAQDEVRTLEQHLADAMDAAHKASKQAEATRDAVAAINSRIASLRAARAGLESQVKLVGPLREAEVRIAELTAQEESIAEELAVQEERFFSLETPIDPPLPDCHGAEAAVDACRKVKTQAVANLALASERLRIAQDTAVRLMELSGALMDAQDNVADWTRLSEDLGRDGLQALEIDAAGPELTELVNDLLRTCVGPRWTVSIETTRQSADGKKQIEGCAVAVTDNQTGHSGDARTLSGGEKVIVGEALSLALTMLACRRSGVRGATLVRDESAAALDPANARAYVAMLRRAADIVGASHVLFVSHSREVQELADARLEIQGGQVRLN